MKTKSKKEKDWVDNYLEDINKWGIFSLLNHFYGVYCYKSDQDDKVLMGNQGRDRVYDGSPLHVRRLIDDAIKEAFYRESQKLEKLKLEGKI